MSAQHILEKFKKFEGRQLIDCADEIQALANELDLLFDAMDPEINKSSIDVESNRLDVRTDNDSKIISFKLG